MGLRSRSGARRRWKVIVIPLAAAVFVAAVALGAAVLGDRLPGRAASTTTADTRPYTYHGLTLDVPASWPVDALQCGVARKNTIVVAQIIEMCQLDARWHVSVVAFAHGPQTYLHNPIEVRHPTRTAVVVDGRQVTKITGTSAGDAGSAEVAKGDPIVVFLVRSLRITAAIQSPDRDLVERIAASIRFVRTDANGCRARRTDLRTLPTGRPPARPGADTTLIPGHPTHVAVCRYDYGDLEQSTTVTGKARADLLRTLNGLPSGLSIDPSEDWPPSVRCTRQRQVPSGYTVAATYDRGRPVTVWVRLGECYVLGASNGTRTGQRGPVSGPLVRAITELVGSGRQSLGDVRPARAHVR